MDPIDSDLKWSIFFVVALAGMSCQVEALPVDAWGIFFVAGGLGGGFVSAGVVDRAQDLADMQQYNEVKGFFRVEANIVRLQNDDGLEHNGLPCDGPVGKCDPRISAFVDTERPNHDFGGDSVPYRHYATLLTAEDTNSPVVNRTVTRDVCGHSVRKINIRVRAEDVDTLRNDDKIDNFSCFIYGLDRPALDEAHAEWSPELACDGLDRKNTKIWFKYRWFFIDAKTCRPSSNDRGLLDGLFS
ncbi:hypothetical protein BV898_04763 [Hypsibius exemplaris]|uniref:Uncharacterized protein n=1 Tax=Hypsibius exemplaris TaxID=2072580 RepID=A0A1W0X1B0_HYPEX|nr:hypothetical protein BV898_04763 [Hypsibius exemplaris]